ncbi:flavin-containing monooxygenase [Streptomyces aureus]
MTHTADSSTAGSGAPAEHIDVVIVGAGLSGVGAAYRLQTECPERSYAIVEARQSMGGTWDLFRYPGVRSDSDMFTLGYPFKPWRDRKVLADGGSILSYIKETAAEFGIDRRIRYGTKVLAADWSTRAARWTVTLERTDEDGHRTLSTVTCDFLYSCAGYYDYDKGHTPSSRAPTPSPARSCTRSSGPRTWTTRASASSSSAAAPPPSRWSPR